MSSRIALYALLFCTSLAASAATAPISQPTDPAKTEAIKQKIGGLHIPFTENRGQTDASVAYYANTFAGTVYVTKQGELVYALPAKSDDEDKPATRVLKEIPVNGKAKPAPGEAAETKVSRFIGNDKAKWQAGLNTYNSVKLGEVWEGIDVSLKAYGNNMEKLYTVAPGARVQSIQMKVEGAQSLKLNEDGTLEAKTEDGPVKFTAPIAWQEIDGKKKPVTVAYAIDQKSYGFKLGSYDPKHEVMIDPLLQSTYLGGSGSESSVYMVFHPVTGDVYVSGYTTSTNFPTTIGSVQAAYGGGSYDMFVARFNSTLTSLLQATYLGGSGVDYANSLAIHPLTNEIYVAGYSYSSNFPGTSGSAQAAIAGAYDMAIARFDSSLTTLLQSTYLGGTGGDSAGTITIHPQTGEIYVAGYTSSIDFPGKSGGAQTNPDDIAIARLNGALTTLLQSTYFGGGGLDRAHQMIAHPFSGDIYVTGYTDSISFPFTSGGAQSTLNGPTDAYVTRLNSQLTAISQSTYVGGSGDEKDFYHLAIDSQTGDVYVTGRTYSSDLPGTAGGAQPVYGGGGDVFVERLNQTLTSNLQATYLGGTGSESSAYITIHPQSRDIYISGFSSATDFPGTVGGVQPSLNATTDIVVARFSNDLTKIPQTTYLGGSSTDSGQFIAIHPQTGEVYVGGISASTDFPGAFGGAQQTNGGSNDVVIARLSPSLALNDYTLTTLLAGTGSGTITSSDGLINCGSDCSEVYGNFTSVTLTAIPGTDSTFAGWSNACTGTGTCTVTMDAAKNVTATFNLITYDLTVSKVGLGTGSVTATGINCGADCSESFAAGTMVTLAATPDANMAFLGWSGACSGATLFCTVTMDAAKSVTATFDLTRYGLTVAKSGSGTGTVSATGINCGADCSELYDAGTLVTLTATPDANMVFGGWSGACSGSATTCTVTMDAAKSVTAKFNATQFTLTTSAKGNGTITSGDGLINCGTDCSETYRSRTSVTLTATPAAGNIFTGWTGSGCSGTGICTVSMTANKSVRANFSRAAIAPQ